MEIVMPVQDLQFESATTTPYMSAPSSPKHFGLDPLESYYPYSGLLSSPTDDDFAFDFISHLNNNAQPPPLTSADELFEQGKIRPLKPPPRLSSSVSRTTPVSVSPSHSLKGSRKERTREIQNPINSQNPQMATMSCSCKGGGEGSWKLRIKDFLLFRSASEGRATGDRNKDFLQKFTALPFSSSFQKNLKKEGGRDVSRSSSFRSVDSNGSARRGSARRDVSPHARHYAENKAATEEMKKRTALPYRQSFFSCLRFSPALHSLTSRGW